MAPVSAPAGGAVGGGSIAAPLLAETLIDGKTLEEYVNATPEGAVCTLPPGILRGAFPINVRCEVRGAGAETAADGTRSPNPTIIDGEGMTPFWGQGGVVPRVSGAKLSNFTIRNFQGDASVAGIRITLPDISVDTEGVEIYGCPMGMLTNGGVCKQSLTRNHIHHNGDGSGMNHNVYLGHADWAEFVDNWVHDCNGGHAIKSRAQKNTGSGNKVSAANGALYDFPVGGLVDLSDENWAKPAGSSDFKLFAFGEESFNHLDWYGENPGKAIALTGIRMDTPNGSEFFWLRDGTALTLSDVTDTGPTTPKIEWMGAGGTVTGSFSQVP
jgi:hypothetical protein